MTNKTDCGAEDALGQAWEKARRIVIKLGTQIVMSADGGPARRRLAGIVSDCSEAWRRGKEVLLVSSGAVGLGRKSLNLSQPGKSLTLIEKQAFAAVGQTLLMDLYRECFAEHGIKTAQVLLTASDFADRRRYLTLRQTLEKLLSFRTVPIINENDTLSTMELETGAYAKSFGDNDKLSALVASKLNAELLIMLTDVTGIYTENPEQAPSARRIERIENFEQLARIQVDGESALGRGGMAAKIEAARIASISGVHVLIRSGLAPDCLSCLTGAEPDRSGTWVLARGTLPKRRQWIGFASGSSGTIVVNEGAHHALVEGRASLLPIGVRAVEGGFQAGQVISIQDEQGNEVGRGISSFSAQEIRQIQGAQSEAVRGILGRSCPAEVIHRDNLVVFEEHFRDDLPEGSVYDGRNG
jgi:glutamate 5-kinase